MHLKGRPTTAVAATMATLLLALTLVAGLGPRPLGATSADAAGAGLRLTGPSTAKAGEKIRVTVRVRKGVRGKVALQTQRGSRWVTLRSQRPQDGVAGFVVPAPTSGGGGGGFRLRAKAGPRTSPVLTIKVRPKTPPAQPDPSAPPEFDARCKKHFGSGTRVLEKEHRVRPLGWPRTPAYAVLCRLVHVTADEEYGCYATDDGTKIFDVFWDYQHAIPGSAVAPTEDGEVLTGVLGDASFYIEQVRFDEYYVVWARDGNYEDIPIDC